MAFAKYDSSGNTLYGFGPCRITKQDLSTIASIFQHLQISNSWQCEGEAIRVDVVTGNNDHRIFQFLKLSRRRFLFRRQRLWLASVDGSWQVVRYRLLWEDDMAFVLGAVIKNGSSLPYYSAGDALATLNDHCW